MASVEGGWLSRSETKAVQPRLDGIRLESNQPVNATAGNLVLRGLEIERGLFDIEPRGEFFDGEHDADTPGESLDTPSPPNMGCPRSRRQSRCETDWVAV